MQFLGGAPTPRPIQYGDAVAANPEPYWVRGTTNITDPLNRYVRTGLGTARLGGNYSSSISSPLSVSGGAGRVATLAPGTTLTSTLQGVSTRDELFQAVFSLRTLPTAGRGVSFGVELRRQGNGDAYRAVVNVAPTGAATMALRRQLGDDTTTLAARTAPFHVVAGKPFVVEGYVADGNGAEVMLRTRAWRVNATIPGWQLAMIDTASQALATPGRYGLYVSTAGNTQGVQTNVWSVDGWTLARKSTPGSSSPAPSSAGPSSGSTRSSSTSPPRTSSAAGPTTTAPPTSGAPTTSSSSPPPAPVTATVPGPTNTGVPAGTNLTVHHGTIDIRTPGTVIDGLDVHGFVLVEASHVRIRNSIIRGGVATHAIGLVDAVYPNVTDLVVQDTTLIASTPKPGLDGIKGKNFTAIRLNISRTIDGGKVLGGNVVIRDSYIHGLTTFQNDPYQHGTPSHSDGIQVESGSNITLANNMIVGGYNSGVQITQDVGMVRTLSLTGNVIGGGACTVNVSQLPRSGMTGINIANNRFTRTSKYGCPMIIDRSVGLSAHANFYTANAMPYAAQTTDPAPITLRR